MPWVDVTAWVLVLGTTAVIIVLGPRIWHSASVQRSRRMGGFGVFDEIWRPATYEQRIAEERAAEGGDSVEQLEPKRPDLNVPGARQPQ